MLSLVSAPAVSIKLCLLGATVTLISSLLARGCTKGGRGETPNQLEQKEPDDQEVEERTPEGVSGGQPQTTYS